MTFPITGELKEALEMRKYFVVKTGVCGALFLAGVGLVAGKFMEPEKAAPVQRINHYELLTMDEADITPIKGAVPYTDWNNVDSEVDNKLQCEGGYSVSVVDVTTSGTDSGTLKPFTHEYAFLKIVNNGFTLAETDNTATFESYAPEEQVNAKGGYVSNLTASGKNGDGDSITFHMFATSAKKDAPRSETAFSLVLENTTKGTAKAVACQFISASIKRG